MDLRLVLFSALFVPAAQQSTITADYTTEQSWYLMRLSGAAYSPAPRKCIRNIMPKKEKWKLSINCSRLDTCAFFATKSEVTKQVLFAFRGSYGYTQIPNELFQTVFFRKSFLDGRIHSYFYDAFNATWPFVQSVLETYNSANYSYIFTGHSLGGALAVLCAAQAAEVGLVEGNTTVVRTFGQPRVGNAGFAQAVDRLLPGATRVVNAADLIAHVPACVPDGLAGCTPWNLGYYHHGRELWYADGLFGLRSNYTVCTASDEDPDCSNSLVFSYTYDNHSGQDGYFHMDPQVYGANNCNDTILN